LGFGGFGFFLQALVDGFEDFMKVLKDVVTVFVVEENAIVLEDIFEVGFLGFVDHLLVLMDLLLPKFLVDG
jgi:hypothetical protein